VRLLSEPYSEGPPGLRIFLTGATGFIGGHLLRALSARGHEVTCLARGAGARRIAAMALPGVRVVEGEFTHPDEWIAAVAGQGPDLIYGPADNVGVFVTTKTILPLEKIFPEEFFTRFTPQGVVSRKEQRWLVADQIGNHLTLVYNTDLVPKPPATLDEFVKFSQKTEPGAAPGWHHRDRPVLARRVRHHRNRWLRHGGSAAAVGRRQRRVLLCGLVVVGHRKRSL